MCATKNLMPSVHFLHLSLLRSLKSPLNMKKKLNELLRITATSVECVKIKEDYRVFFLNRHYIFISKSKT